MSKEDAKNLTSDALGYALQLQFPQLGAEKTAFNQRSKACPASSGSVKGVSDVRVDAEEIRGKQTTVLPYSEGESSSNPIDHDAIGQIHTVQDVDIASLVSIINDHREKAAAHLEKANRYDQSADGYELALIDIRKELDKSILKSIEMERQPPKFDFFDLGAYRFGRTMNGEMMVIDFHFVDKGKVSTWTMARQMPSWDIVTINETKGWLIDDFICWSAHTCGRLGMALPDSYGIQNHLKEHFIHMEAAVAIA